MARIENLKIKFSNHHSDEDVEKVLVAASATIRREFEKLKKDRQKSLRKTQKLCKRAASPKLFDKIIVFLLRGRG